MPGKIRGALIYLTRNPDPELLARTLSRTAELLPGLPVYCNRPLPAAESAGVQLAEGSSLFVAAKQAYASAAAKSPAGEDDGFAVFKGLCPFLDTALARELMDVHLKYYAHYSYVENASIGFLPDFVSSDFLAQAEPGAQDLRDFVFKNIERFDVEVLYREPDLRQFRLDFACESDRSLRLAKSLLSIAPDVKYADLGQVVRANPEILRPFPSYFEVELTGRRALSPRIVPVPGDETDLEFALFEKLCADIEKNALREDASICFGGWGEPALHPQFSAALARALTLPVETVYLETYGAGYSPEIFDAAARMPGAEKLCVIVRLATLRRDRYEYLYGADRFSEVMNLVTRFESQKFPFKVYMEMPRIKDVDDEVTPYYDRFEKTGLPVILNKFNRYIDLLEERRVTDLVPLEREFCWHLARDFVLNRHGKVPVCKQDVTGRGPALDFRTLSIGEITAKTMPYHTASVQGRNDAVPMPCLACDEWYTFNA